MNLMAADSQIAPANTDPTYIDGDVYDDGYLRVEHANYYVVCGGKRISLALKEFLILSRLARNPGRVVTAQELWQSVWGMTELLNGVTLRVHIYNLRQKLSPYGVGIENMVNVGYRLSTTEVI